MPFEPYGDHIDQHGTPLRKDYTSSHTVGIQSVGDWGTHGASLVAGRLVIGEKWNRLLLLFRSSDHRIPRSFKVRAHNGV